MAHIRTIKPDFFTDPDLIALPEGVRLFFAGLWTQADREGRLEDDPRSLKLKLFPDQKVDIENRLQALSPKQVIRYVGTDGRKYLQIRNFLKHQRPHHSEAPSVIPTPTSELTDSSPIATGYAPEITALKGKEGKGRERKGTLSPGFALFWDCYPKKVAKKDAVRAWNKLNPENGLVERIVAKLGEMKMSEDWLKNNGEYIPYPASWLNGERWNDEEPTGTSADLPEYLRRELPRKETADVE